MPTNRKMRTVLNHLEMVRTDIERTIDQSDNRDQWREIVRGVLVYWLSSLYDEGAGYTKDLETSLAILHDQIDGLKKQSGTSNGSD